MIKLKTELTKQKRENGEDVSLFNTKWMKGGEKQIHEKKYDDENLEKKMKEYTLKFKDNFVPE